MNIGIIGLGRIGLVHLEALQRVKSAKIVAVSDIDEKRCREVVETYQIPNYYLEAEEITTHPEVDAVWVCSPSNLHHLHVCQALSHNKFVFCEKPLETTIPKIKDIIAKFSDLERRLMVGFNRRFDPHFAHLQANLKQIGKPTILKITSRDPAPPPLSYIKSSGGIYKDMTIHDFDMARFIAQSEVEEVFATGQVNYLPEIEGLDLDTTLVTLKFENGLICNIDNSRLSVYGYDQRLEIHGAKGMLQADNQKIHNCTLYSDANIGTSLLQNFFLDRYKAAYLQEAVVFFDCIASDKPFPVGAEDALKALILAEACSLSVKEKRVVYIGEFE